MRDVDDGLKKQAFDRYGIQNPVTADYEVDHLISLELCGSNAIENLWPESYKPVPGAHEKDRVEDSLHDEVCKGTKTLQEAQEIIRTDWYAEYQRLEAGAIDAPKKTPARSR